MKKLLSFITKHFKKIVSLVFYGSGLLAMFLVDIVITSKFTLNEISEWAIIKSIIFISAPITLLGVDHALVRSPALIKKATEVVIFQVIVISIAIILLLDYLDIIKISFITFFIIIIIAMVQYFFALYRATFHIAQAQYIINAWKVIMLFIVTTSSFLFEKPSIDLILLISLLIPFLLFFKDIKTIKEIFSITDNSEDEEKTLSGLYKIGMNFSITMVLLNVSLHLQQIMVKYSGNSYLSALYFSHIITIVSPIVVFNGYINFYLGPYVRKRKKNIFNNIKKDFLKFIVFCIVISSFGYFFGITLFQHLYKGKYILDNKLSVIILLTAFLRMLFIIPSSFLAVLGNKKQLNYYVFFNFIGVFAFITMFTIRETIGLNLIYAVSLGVLLNWIIRTLSGYILLTQVYRERRL